MFKVSFFIPVKPVRWSVSCFNNIMYSPPKLKAYQKQIIPIIRANCRTAISKGPFEGELVLRVIVYMPRGKTVKREFHTVKPDTTNLVKAVEDCLTKAGLIKDDCQIIHQINSKVYEVSGRVGTYIELFSPDAIELSAAITQRFIEPC